MLGKGEHLQLIHFPPTYNCVKFFGGETDTLTSDVGVDVYREGGGVDPCDLEL